MDPPPRGLRSVVRPQGENRVDPLRSLITTLLTFLFSIMIYLRFDTETTEMQFTYKVPWIESFSIFYGLGIDGISLPMILLTALLFFLCILSSWTIEKSLKAYFALFLMLESAVIGVFTALDFFLFYVYWEVMLIPMFFLIGIWGGENKEYAAVKFFLYTFFGSVLLLAGMAALYFTTGAGRGFLQHYCPPGRAVCGAKASTFSAVISLSPNSSSS